MFQVYDGDGSGSISMREMVILFASLYQTEGLQERIAVERAEALFGKLDINGDGDITEEEFVKACLMVNLHAFKLLLLLSNLKWLIWWNRISRLVSGR